MASNPFKAASGSSTFSKPNSNPFALSKTNTTGYIPITNPTSSYPQNNYARIGSYRPDRYVQRGIMDPIISNNPDGSHGQTILKCYASGPAFQGISLMEARLQDYHCMRTGNMSQENNKALEVLKRKGLMNKDIVDNNNQPVVPLSITTNPHNPNVGTVVGTNSNPNPFSTMGNSTLSKPSNPFANPNSSAPMNSSVGNPFKPNSSNPFQNTQVNTGTTPNPFANSSQNMSGSIANPFKTSTSLNPFQNNSTNTTSNNLFTNNNSIFTNNNKNNSNTQNPFNNNNNNNNNYNPFNNNNNNNNNPFNNNMNKSINIFNPASNNNNNQNNNYNPYNNYNPFQANNDSLMNGTGGYTQFLITNPGFFNPMAMMGFGNPNLLPSLCGTDPSSSQNILKMQLAMFGSPHLPVPQQIYKCLVESQDFGKRQERRERDEQYGAKKLSEFDKLDVEPKRRYRRNYYNQKGGEDDDQEEDEFDKIFNRSVRYVNPLPPAKSRNPFDIERREEGEGYEEDVYMDDVIRERSQWDRERRFERKYPSGGQSRSVSNVSNVQENVSKGLYVFNVTEIISVDNQILVTKELTLDLSHKKNQKISIEDEIRSHAISQGLVKPLAQVTIVSNTITSGEHQIVCRIKSREINLPKGYWTKPEVPTDPKRTKLTIGNQLGEVTWENQIDVTSIDFSDCIDIKEGSVELYERVPEPPVGSGLNQTFVATYYRSDIVYKIREMQKGGVRTDRVMEKVKSQMARRGMELLSLDMESGRSSVRVVPIPATLPR